MHTGGLKGGSHIIINKLLIQPVVNPDLLALFPQYTVHETEFDNFILGIIRKLLLIHDDLKNKFVKVGIVRKVFDQTLKIGVVPGQGYPDRLFQVPRFPFLFRPPRQYLFIDDLAQVTHKERVPGRIIKQLPGEKRDVHGHLSLTGILIQHVRDLIGGKAEIHIKIDGNILRAVIFLLVPRPDFDL